MAIINQILSALTGGSSQNAGATGGAQIASVVQQMLGADPSQGVNGLVQKFEAAGLANVIQSWIGTGQNLPITPEQLQQALGAAHLDQLAQSAGLNSQQLLQNLSQVLPGVIDTLTPNGQVSQGAGGLLTGLLNQLGQKT